MKKIIILLASLFISLQLDDSVAKILNLKSSHIVSDKKKLQEQLKKGFHV